MNDRIKAAFRCPAALTDDDIADLVAMWAKDARAASKRRKRLQNAGGTDGKEHARNEAVRRLRALKTAAE